MFDARAKDAYRRRLAEIEDDIEQARALKDTEREVQADVEHDFLVRELSRAVGSVAATDEPGQPPSPFRYSRSARPQPRSEAPIVDIRAMRSSRGDTAGSLAKR